MKKAQQELMWRVHTPNLLKEVLESNNGMAIFQKPFMILKGILCELSECAIRIGDPELNAIMCRLTLYEEGDPQSADYNKDVYEKVMILAYGKVGQ